MALARSLACWISFQFARHGPALARAVDQQQFAGRPQQAMQIVELGGRPPGQQAQHFKAFGESRLFAPRGIPHLQLD